MGDSLPYASWHRFFDSKSGPAGESGLHFSKTQEREKEKKIPNMSL
jgi:hypothetical protein